MHAFQRNLAGEIRTPVRCGFCGAPGRTCAVANADQALCSEFMSRNISEVHVECQPAGTAGRSTRACDTTSFVQGIGDRTNCDPDPRSSSVGVIITNCVFTGPTGSLLHPSSLCRSQGSAGIADFASSTLARSSSTRQTPAVTGQWERSISLASAIGHHHASRRLAAPGRALSGGHCS